MSTVATDRRPVTAVAAVTAGGAACAPTTNSVSAGTAMTAKTYTVPGITCAAGPPASPEGRAIGIGDATTSTAIAANSGITCTLSVGRTASAARPASRPSYASGTAVTGKGTTGTSTTDGIPTIAAGAAAVADGVTTGATISARGLAGSASRTAPSPSHCTGTASRVAAAFAAFAAGRVAIARRIAARPADPWLPRRH